MKSPGAVVQYNYWGKFRL